MVEASGDDGPALLLDRVTQRFGEVTALADITLAVAPGEVVGLLGHNGAGKTTTVRVLAGLLAPEGGTARVVGLDPTVDGPAVRRRIGVLPASPVVDDRLTGVQNLRFAADVFQLPIDGLEERITRSLEAFGLGGRSQERVSGYSTGMRQRLALARVLLPDPEILLLDEPTSALDPIAARQVRRSLASLAREHRRTVVLCTHDLMEADQLCDRVVVLENGRVVADGSPAELTAAHGTGRIQLEVATRDVTAAVRQVSALTAGEVDTDGGGRLRATGVPREMVPELVRRLAADGLEVFEVRRIEPTLEDVYLALHGRLPDEDEPSAHARSETP